MFKNFLNSNWPVIILLVLSLLTRFIMLNHPAEVVFDEVYFGQFVQSYFSHQYYFDIHPPLGKLMIFEFAKIFGFNGQLKFSGINSVLTSGGVLVLRFLPALFSVFFVILIYYLILKLKLSKRAAFLGACLVLFDNAILAQSKFILIDIFLLFFGFLSLYFLICYKDSEKGSRKSYYFLALAAIFSTLSFSIKWTGVSFFAILLVCLVFNFFRDFNIKRIFINLAIVIVLPFLVYYSVFFVHFNLLYKSGTGDAYMSPTFQQTLAATGKANSLSAWEKFIELNQKMYFYNSTLKATHPYSSKWYQWPLDKRPIWYWTETVNNKISNIYLFGNPIVWYSVLLAIIFSITIIPFKHFRKQLPPIFYLLLFAYFLNLLPFIFISRVAFLYHYLPSLVFGILVLITLYDRMASDGKSKPEDGLSFFPSKKHAALYVSYLFVLIAIFIIISPLTYGIPVSRGLSNFYSHFIGLFL